MGVGFGGYFLFEQKTSTYPSLGLYINSDFHFQIQLPNESTSGTYSPVIYSAGNGDTGISFNKSNLNLKYFNSIIISKNICQKGDVVFIGDTSFVRNTELSTEVGISNVSFEGFYCIENDGLSYTLIFDQKYIKGSPALDEIATLQKFEQELKILKIQFIN